MVSVLFLLAFCWGFNMFSPRIILEIILNYTSWCTICFLWLSRFSGLLERVLKGFLSGPSCSNASFRQEPLRFSSFFPAQSKVLARWLLPEGLSHKHWMNQIIFLCFRGLARDSEVSCPLMICWIQKTSTTNMHKHHTNYKNNSYSNKIIQPNQKNKPYQTNIIPTGTPPKKKTVKPTTTLTSACTASGEESAKVTIRLAMAFRRS